MKNNSAVIGRVIKRCREDFGISKTDLAEMLNVSLSAVSNWETGSTYPDISKVSPICEIFNISPNSLFGYTDFYLEMSEREKKNFTRYQSLDMDGKAKVDICIKDEFDRCKTLSVSPDSYNTVSEPVFLPPEDPNYDLNISRGAELKNKKKRTRFTYAELIEIIESRNPYYGAALSEGYIYDIFIGQRCACSGLLDVIEEVFDEVFAKKVF